MLGEHYRKEWSLHEVPPIFSECEVTREPDENDGHPIVYLRNDEAEIARYTIGWKGRLNRSGSGETCRALHKDEEEEDDSDGTLGVVAS